MIGIAQREEPSSSGTLVVWGAAGHAIVLLDLLDIKIIMKLYLLIEI